MANTRSSGLVPPTEEVHITALIDTSGSMCDLKHALEEGIGVFCQTQNEDANKENRTDTTHFTLVFFNTNSSIVYQGLLKDLDIKSIVVTPHGMTRLYDTVTDSALDLIRKKTKSTRDVSLPKKCMLVIMTDGHNTSGTPTPDKMKETIVEARRHGVICTFIAANQDAQDVGDDFGFGRDGSLTFSPDPRTTVNALRAASSGASRALSQGHAPTYTPLERQSSQACSPPHKRRQDGIPDDFIGFINPADLDSDYTDTFGPGNVGFGRKRTKLTRS